MCFIGIHFVFPPTAVILDGGSPKIHAVPDGDGSNLKALAGTRFHAGATFLTHFDELRGLARHTGPQPRGRGENTNVNTGTTRKEGGRTVLVKSLLAQ